LVHLLSSNSRKTVFPDANVDLGLRFATNGERTLSSAWLKQGRDWLMANVVEKGRLSLTDFLPEVRRKKL
jgi:hypothetical protein